MLKPTDSGQFSVDGEEQETRHFSTHHEAIQLYNLLSENDWKQTADSRQYIFEKNLPKRQHADHGTSTTEDTINGAIFSLWVDNIVVLETLFKSRGGRNSPCLVSARTKQTGIYRKQDTYTRNSL